MPKRAERREAVRPPAARGIVCDSLPDGCEFSTAFESTPEAVSSAGARSLKIRGLQNVGPDASLAPKRSAARRRHGGASSTRLAVTSMRDSERWERTGARSHGAELFLNTAPRASTRGHCPTGSAARRKAFRIDRFSWFAPSRARTAAPALNRGECTRDPGAASRRGLASLRARREPSSQRAESKADRVVLAVRQGTSEVGVTPAKAPPAEMRGGSTLTSPIRSNARRKLRERTKRWHGRAAETSAEVGAEELPPPSTPGPPSRNDGPHENEVHATTKMS
jgi:hypothetical protein